MTIFDSLSREEMDTLCRWIGEKSFKAYFGKNQNTLIKVHRDCRVKKLNMTQIRDIVFKKKNDEFIYSYLDGCVESLFKQFEKYKKEKTDNDIDPEIAMIQTLAESPFTDNIPLFFKLCNNTVSEEYIRLTAAMVAIAKKQLLSISTPPEESTPISGQQNTAELDAQIAELKAVTQQYSEQIAALHQTVTNLQTANQQAETKLAVYHEKEQRLRQIKFVADYGQADYQFLSICHVVYNSRLSDGQLALHRLADVKDGFLVPFIEDITIPHTFTNRDWLYKKNGPDINDYYGAWNWNVINNRNDPSKDYIQSQYNPNCLPIEIIESPDSTDIHSLSESLTAGIQSDTFCGRMLWCFGVGQDLIGFLVERKQMIGTGNQLKLASDIYELPLYRFSMNETLALGSKQKRFLRVLDPGTPDDIYKLYDPVELMKQMLLEKMSWSAMRTKDITKAQWQTFRSFLQTMSANDFLQEFCEKCGCSSSEATDYLNELIKKADCYISRTDVPTDALIRAVQSSKMLEKQCAELLRSQWETEHEQELNQAKAELLRVLEELENKQKQADMLRSEKERLTSEIQKKEALASDVEQRISSRIEAAKKNAAEFISEMAFIPSSVMASPKGHSIFHPGTNIEVDHSIIIENVDDLLEHMQYELINAGINSEDALSFAAYLYAAYCNKTPVLLAGPNGTQIANALSICLTGKTVSTIDCNQEYTSEWADEMIRHNAEIIAFRNPFRHDWIHPIMEQLEAPDRFYLLLHPFAEDLCIEPAGLLNYILPVFTEPFVSGKANGTYTRPDYSEGFTHYPKQKNNVRLHASLLKKLFPQQILRSSIQQLVTDLHFLLPETAEDTDMMLSVIPSAFIINRGNILLDELEKSEKDVKRSIKHLRERLGTDT